MSDSGGQTAELRILGTKLKVRTNGARDEIEQAAAEVEQYVQSIQSATRMADSRQLLLVALLNQTMEMRRMKKNMFQAGGQESLVKWATDLTSTIRETLG